MIVFNIPVVIYLLYKSFHIQTISILGSVF